MDTETFTAETFKSGQTLLFDKPLEWTSFQLVNKVRWMIRRNSNFKIPSEVKMNKTSILQ